jgi:hypothetical protein
VAPDGNRSGALVASAQYLQLVRQPVSTDRRQRGIGGDVMDLFVRIFRGRPIFWTERAGLRSQVLICEQEKQEDERDVSHKSLSSVG